MKREAAKEGAGEGKLKRCGRYRKLGERDKEGGHCGQTGPLALRKGSGCVKSN